MTMRWLLPLVLLLASTAHAAPRVEGTHFYEVYWCDQLRFVMWATPDLAGSVKLEDYPELDDATKRGLFLLRGKADEQGNLREVRIEAQQCPEV